MAHCDLCGKNWDLSSHSRGAIMRKLRADARSGVSKALFSRKIDDYSDYDRISVCEKCVSQGLRMGYQVERMYSD